MTDIKELRNLLEEWRERRMDGHAKRVEHVRAMWASHPGLMLKIDPERLTENC